MSDNGEEEAEEPAVELGDGDPVVGAPVARVASRLFFPIERSDVLRREGDTTIRTSDGPRTLESVLERSDEVYFEQRHDLRAAVESVVGTGPVPTADDEPAADGGTEADDTESDEE